MLHSAGPLTLKVRAWCTVPASPLLPLSTVVVTVVVAGSDAGALMDVL